MTDAGGEIKASIDALRPTGKVDETPAGRQAGIDADTWQVYADMYELLSIPIMGVNPAEYEARLADLVEALSDLHRQGRSDEPVVRRDPPEPRYQGGRGDSRKLRYPPDGDIARWVTEGPPGHIRYTGGPVEW
jgi:hypothetical protein